jgi:VCBS repeat-containing protein
VPGPTAPRARWALRLLAAIQIFLLLASLFAPIPIAAADPSPDPSAPAASAEASPPATPESTPDPSPVPTPDTSPTPAPEATAEASAAPSVAPAAAPTISSDKADYAPGELVTLAGSNWHAGESVHISVNDSAGSTWSRSVDVVADASGDISDQFNLPNWFVATYSVLATGAVSGTAVTTFTDAIQTTLNLIDSVSPSVVGQSVTFTATVTYFGSGGGHSSGDPVTEGTVVFGENGNVNCGGGGFILHQAAQTPNASGQVTFATSSLTAGSHLIRACYNGTGGSTGTSSSESALTLVVNANTAPTAVADGGTTTENSNLSVAAPGVLANDTDPDTGTTLAVASINGAAANVGVEITLASGAKVTLNANGSYTYKPNGAFESLDTGETATDSFTYKASDETALSNSATVTITITGVNDAPVANPDSYSVNEDGTLTVNAPGVLGNDTDVDGDSLTASLVSSTTNGSLTFNADGSFTYSPNSNFNGSDSFTYKATDGSLESNITTVTITINAVNDAPVVTTYTVPGSINEGETAHATAVFTDVESDQAHTCVFSWGEGLPTTVPLAAGIFACSADHQYLDDNPSGTAFDTYSVSVTVTDDGTTAGSPDPKSDTALGTILVNNVVPAVDAGSNGSINEGSTFGTTGSFTDPGADIWTATVNYGDGSGTQALTLNPDKTFSLSHVYDDNVGSPFTVTVIVTDDDGGVGTDTLTVTVTNVAPTASLANNGPVAEGSSATISFSAQSDPSGADTTAGFHYAYDCNGGSLALATYATSGTSASAGCTFDDNGAYLVRARIIDKDDGFSEYTTSVTVTNVAPTVDTITVAGSGVACLSGNTASISFTFHDPGVNDANWIVDIDWGDGSSHGADSLASQAGTFGPYSHTYAAGTFAPMVTITDKDGGSGSKTSTTLVGFLFNTSGILQPINLTGTRSSFKIGSTIPVKLRVTDCGGASVGSLTLTVHLARIDPSAESVNEVVSSSAADTGTTMRFDGSGSQYIFNLSTKLSQFNLGHDLTTGTYHLWITGAGIAQVDAYFDARK